MAESNGGNNVSGIKKSTQRHGIGVISNKQSNNQSENIRKSEAYRRHKQHGVNGVIK